MTPPYRLSFTTGGLYLTESVALAEAYLATSDWKQVVTEAGTTVSFSLEKDKSVRRVAREIANRLTTLGKAELEFLVHGADRNEQAAVLWIAICRTYSLIKDFAVEVLSERYASYRREVSPGDYTMFVHDKSEWDKELAGRSASTIERSRQVLFKILREVGLLDSNGQIRRLHLSPRVRKILREYPEDAGIFPGGLASGGSGA